MSDKIRDELHQIAFEIGGTEDGGYAFSPEDLDEFVAKAALAQQPAPVAVPEGINIERIERHAQPAGGYPSSSMVVLLSSIKRMLAASTAAPAPEAQEPVAWLNPTTGDVWWTRRKKSAIESYGTPGSRIAVAYSASLDAGPPAAEQSYSTTSDKYRAELYDEVWDKARGMGYGNVTEALVALERMQAAEQPDTVKVNRKTLERYVQHLQVSGYNNAADDLRALLAGGDA